MSEKMGGARPSHSTVCSLLCADAPPHLPTQPTERPTAPSPIVHTRPLARVQYLSPYPPIPISTCLLAPVVESPTENAVITASDPSAGWRRSTTCHSVAGDVITPGAISGCSRRSNAVICSATAIGTQGYRGEALPAPKWPHDHGAVPRGGMEVGG